MKRLNEILTSKPVRIIATLALIYYIFQSTKNNPSSITSQISGENLHQNLEVVKGVIPRVQKVKQRVELEKSETNQQSQTKTKVNQ